MTWPDPNATALDRARQIARTYRAALAKADPQAAAILDDAARRVDEGWVCGVTTGPQACTVHEAAQLLAVTDRRVRQLIAAGDLPAAGKARDGHVLLVRDVQQYAASRRSAGAASTSALPSVASG